MTAPTLKVRTATERRDGCCLMCTTTVHLEWNHRQNSGHGGRGSKAPKVTPADGVMLCKYCNQAIEADARKQADAIFWGYKVRRFSPVPAERVPVWYRDTGAWFLLDRFGARDELDPVTADELRALAGILPELKGGGNGFAVV